MRILILRVATVTALTTALQVPLAPAAKAVKVVSIADFEKDTDDFSRPLRRDAAVAQQGQGSGKIEATFSSNKRWVTANRVLDLPHEFKEVRFWVCSTDAHGLTFRLIDETGQTHQQRPKFPPDGQWHQITINTFTSGQGYERFGGVADGRFHWPAQSIAFIFEKGNVGDKTGGTLWVDSVEASLDPQPYIPDLKIDQAQLGNIFLTTEPVTIPVRSGGDRISWTVTDIHRSKVAEGSLEVSGNQAEIAPAVQGSGYFELLLTVEKRGVTVAEGRTTFAVVTPIDLEQMPDSPFGVMTHFAQGWDVDIMPLIARAGIRSIRDEQYWQQVEKKPGEFDFSDKFTAYMAEARKLHIDPLIPMTFQNKLYDEGLTPYTPAGCQAYGRYGQAILDQYGPQIQWLEVWNEYNGTWCKGPAAEDRPKFYTQMLKFAYEAIKAKRPDVRVGGGAAAIDGPLNRAANNGQSTPSQRTVGPGFSGHAEFARKCGTLCRDPKNHGNVLRFQSLGGNGFWGARHAHFLQYP